jgi:hypothetical protein
MTIRRIFSWLMTAAVLLAAVPSGHAQGRAGTLTSYYCNPSTCLKYSIGPILKVTMNMYGSWQDVDDPNITRDRAILGTTTTKCSSDVTVDMYGDTVYDSYLGDGIIVVSESSQFGFDVLTRNLRLYMYGTGGTGSGSALCN